MKKILVILLAFIAFGQANAKVDFGFRGGINLVSLGGDNGTFSGTNRNGFYFGPTLRVNIYTTPFSIDASALYDQRTSQVNGTKTYDVTARHFAIPLNCRYSLTVGQQASVFAFAGPQFGFNLSDDQPDGTGEWSWKTTEFSMNVGLGVTLLSHIELKANYNFVCGTTANHSFKQATDDTRYNAWQFGLCWYF